MSTEDYMTTFTVDQTPDEIFKAVSNVRGWWVGDPGAQGVTDKLGAEFTYRYFQDIHYSKQKITELVPGKRVVWDVVESVINYANDKKEWTGTKITFNIARKGDKTELRFTHVGLTPAVECYADCSNSWGSYINTNLRNLIAGS